MFGMGTGGSLRLLSPEIGQGPNPFAAALSDCVSRHSFRLLTSPSCLPLLRSSRALSRFPSQLWASHPQNRTGRFAPFCLTMTSLRSASTFFILPHILFQDQALDRLVSSSSIRYRTSTDDLSTLSSSRGLTCLKQWQFSSLGGLHA